jgi:hypothetical protein
MVKRITVRRVLDGRLSAGAGAVLFGLSRLTLLVLIARAGLLTITGSTQLHWSVLLILLAAIFLGSAAYAWLLLALLRRGRA